MHAWLGKTHYNQHSRKLSAQSDKQITAQLYMINRINAASVYLVSSPCIYQSAAHTNYLWSIIAYDARALFADHRGRCSRLGTLLIMPINHRKTVANVPKSSTVQNNSSFDRDRIRIARVLVPESPHKVSCEFLSRIIINTK